jgi:hypothetical protein
MIHEIVPLVGIEYALILNGINPEILKNMTITKSYE